MYSIYGKTISLSGETATKFKTELMHPNEQSMQIRKKIDSFLSETTSHSIGDDNSDTFTLSHEFWDRLNSVLSDTITQEYTICLSTMLPYQIESVPSLISEKSLITFQKSSHPLNDSSEKKTLLSYDISQNSFEWNSASVSTEQFPKTSKERHRFTDDTTTSFDNIGDILPDAS